MIACAESTDLKVVVAEGGPPADAPTADAFGDAPDGAGGSAGEGGSAGSSDDSGIDASADAPLDSPVDGMGGDAPFDALPDVTPTAGLGLWFKLEEATGSVFDHSGNGNNGTVSGTVLRNIPGKNGMGFDFGTDGRIQVKSSTTLDHTTGATIELWIKLASVTAGAIVSRGTGVNDNAVVLKTTQGNVQAYFARAGQGTSSVISDPGVLGSTWTHVAAVNDGSMLRLYINGTLHKTATGGKMGPISSDLFVGKNAGADASFNGTIDELEWWSVARTEQEICSDAGGAPTVVDGSSSCSLP